MTDKPVKGYVDEQTKKDVQRRADELGISQSALVRKYVKRGLRQDREEQIDAESRAVQRLEQAVDQRLNRLEDLEDDLRDLMARGSAYSIANFELVKTEYGQAQRRESLQTAANRLRDDETIADAVDQDQDQDGAGDVEDDSDGDSLMDRVN